MMIGGGAFGTWWAFILKWANVWMELLLMKSADVQEP